MNEHLLNRLRELASREWGKTPPEVPLTDFREMQLFPAEADEIVTELDRLREENARLRRVVEAQAARANLPKVVVDMSEMNALRTRVEALEAWSRIVSKTLLMPLAQPQDSPQQLVLGPLPAGVQVRKVCLRHSGVITAFRQGNARGVAVAPARPGIWDVEWTHWLDGAGESHGARTFSVGVDEAPDGTTRWVVREVPTGEGGAAAESVVVDKDAGVSTRLGKLRQWQARGCLTAAQEEELAELMGARWHCHFEKCPHTRECSVAGGCKTPAACGRPGEDDGAF